MHRAVVTVVAEFDRCLLVWELSISLDGVAIPPIETQIDPHQQQHQRQRQQQQQKKKKKQKQQHYRDWQPESPAEQDLQPIEHNFLPLQLMPRGELEDSSTSDSETSNDGEQQVDLDAEFFNLVAMGATASSNGVKATALGHLSPPCM
jgi:hypothetical protein